ncbi:DUF7576 family protein [Natronorarus salvus]|uniref:DUF7576 family protein n=1 Tax=Natronorarus salvus TaxID=3117733 RepID=UPI002F26C1BA
MTSDTDQVDVSDSRSDRCTNCGGSIETTDWHPVTTEVDEDGSVELFAFCSWRCRDRFEEG